MISPYFSTYLDSNVSLQPDQLNNELRTNIKKNLSIMYKNKCFKEFGYIMDIYSIQDKLEDGEIKLGDPSSSVYFNVKFHAKLCNPMVNSQIVCKIDGINKHMIIAKNGPIHIIINNKHINKQKFKFNNIKNVLLPLNDKNKEVDDPINSGRYIICTILNKKLVNTDSKILVIGTLDRVAENDEIKENILNENNNNLKTINVADIQ